MPSLCLMTSEVTSLRKPSYYQSLSPHVSTLPLRCQSNLCFLQSKQSSYYIIVTWYQSSQDWASLEEGLADLRVHHMCMLSCSGMSDSAMPWTVAARLLCPWNSPGKNAGVSSHFLLHGIFPTQGSKLDLPYCRHILYLLSHHLRTQGLILCSSILIVNWRFGWGPWP